MILQVKTEKQIPYISWPFNNFFQSYSDIKLIHIMLTDSFWLTIHHWLNNRWKDVILFLKTFLDGWEKSATKSP